MKVPPIGAFGGFTHKNTRPQLHKTKMLNPDRSNAQRMRYPNLHHKNDLVAFASTAKYLKKYSTLPDRIKEELPPKDAIDMFKDMELVAQGKINRPKIGQGANLQVYETPWLKDYCFIIVKENPQQKETHTIYSSKNLGNAVWSDKDNTGIQIIEKFTQD